MERASIMSRIGGTTARPTALGRTGVMSANARPPATVNAGGPATGSGTGMPNIVRAAVAVTTRNAERPIGVTGRVSPWARLAHRNTRSPSPAGGGSGCSVVIDRDWVSHTAPPPSIAHSMSCGAPK